MNFVPWRAKFKNIRTLVVCDHGSTMGLITYSYARTLNLKGWKVKQWVRVASKPWELWETKIYLVPLVNKMEKIHRVKCFGVDLINSKLEKVLIDGVVHRFPKYAEDQLIRPLGHVQALIGLNMLDIFPVGPTPIAEGLGIFQTFFGSGYILAGSHRKLKQKILTSVTTHN